MGKAIGLLVLAVLISGCVTGSSYRRPVSDWSSEKQAPPHVQGIQGQRLDGHQFIYNNKGNQVGYINNNERPRLDGKKMIYNNQGQQTGYTK